MAPNVLYPHIPGFAVGRALKLRECIHDVGSTTARCASASMAPGNG
jgi:hypothetical protein